MPLENGPSAIAANSVASKKLIQRISVLIFRSKQRNRSSKKRMMY